MEALDIAEQVPGWLGGLGGRGVHAAALQRVVGRRQARAVAPCPPLVPRPPPSSLTLLLPCSPACPLRRLRTLTGCWTGRKASTPPPLCGTRPVGASCAWSAVRVDVGPAAGPAAVSLCRPYHSTHARPTAPPPHPSPPLRALLGWREVAALRKKLEDLRELRELVRQLGRGGGKGPLKKAPEQVRCVRVACECEGSGAWRRRAGGARHGWPGAGPGAAFCAPSLPPPHPLRSVCTPPPACLLRPPGIRQQVSSRGHPLAAAARGDAGAHALGCEATVVQPHSHAHVSSPALPAPPGLWLLKPAALFLLAFSSPAGDLSRMLPFEAHLLAAGWPRWEEAAPSSGGEEGGEGGGSSDGERVLAREGSRAARMLFMARRCAWLAQGACSLCVRRSGAAAQPICMQCTCIPGLACRPSSRPATHHLACLPATMQGGAPADELRA